MNEYISNQKRLFYIFLVAIHFVIMVPIVALSNLLYGNADVFLVITYGIVNFFFVQKLLKNTVFLNSILGLFIASFSLNLVYFINFLFQSLDLANSSIILYLIFSLIAWTFVIIWDKKVKNHNQSIILFLIPTMFLCYFSIILNYYYPKKVLSENLIDKKVKFVNYQNISISNADIQVNVYFKPLFGLKEIHKIDETKIQNEGFQILKLSKKFINEIEITTKDKKYYIEKISIEKVKNKDSIIVKLK